MAHRSTPLRHPPLCRSWPSPCRAAHSTYHLCGWRGRPHLVGGRVSSLVLWPSKSSFHTVVAPSSCGVRGSQCGRPSVGFDQEPGAIRCSRTRQPVVAGSPMRVPLAAAHPWLRFPWPRPLPTGKAATLRCPCFETQERLAARQPEFFPISVRKLARSRCRPLFAEPPRWGIPRLACPRPVLSGGLRTEYSTTGPDAWQ